MSGHRKFSELRQHLDGMQDEDELAEALVVAARELGQCHSQVGRVRCGGVAGHEPPCQFGTPRLTVKAAWRNGGKAAMYLEEGATHEGAAREVRAYLDSGAIEVTVTREPLEEP